MAIAPSTKKSLHLLVWGICFTTTPSSAATASTSANPHHAEIRYLGSINHHDSTNNGGHLVTIQDF